MKPLVIANPLSRRGRTGARWPEIEARLRSSLDTFDLAFTREAGHAIALAREAVRGGCRHLIAVGGDGTMNEVANGMAQGGGGLPPADVVLSPIPSGTGSDTARMLGLLENPARPYTALVAGASRRIDLIRVRCAGLDARPVERLALVCASFGAAAEISHRTSASPVLKALGGRFSYYAHTLAVTLTYGRHPVAMAHDAEPAERCDVYTGLICNQERAGGGMRLAPGADPRDGELDLVLFGAIRRRDILLRGPRWLYEGRHVEHPQVSLRRIRRLAVDGPAEMLVDLDGETVGRLPLEAEALPTALTLGA
ncbi:MAG: diacylglycerol kinase family lipid kinase [Alphaproteobacteria bacterium]|nr:diacylglycerol kinase family lipid kinase [Alphaproteobacteria bacterium]